MELAKRTEGARDRVLTGKVDDMETLQQGTEKKKRRREMTGKI